MWLIAKDLPRIGDAQFIIIGKALFISQKYETTCKDILAWILTAHKLTTENIRPFSEEYMQYSEKLKSMFLRQIINRANSLIPNLFTRENYDILDRASNSRNWIAHECCFEMIGCHFSNSTPEVETELIISHLKNIISADYFVSKWSFEFHEKESGSFFNKEKYLNDILNWVSY